MFAKIVRSLFILTFSITLCQNSNGALANDGGKHKKGFYTIVTPARLRSESIFHVSLTLNDFHKSCWFNISVTNYIDDKKLCGLDSIEVKPRTTRLVELKTPKFNSTLGNINIVGYRGIISQDSSLISLDNNEYWAFVQTSQPKYRPGDLVKFRVMYIDLLRRPVDEKQKITVNIYDGESNLIRVFDNVKLVQGIFRSEFQLSDHPVLGSWRIEGLLNGLNLADKVFEVNRYDLPKFYVKIKSKNVAFNEEQLELEISANYFYGEPVRGNLSITITNTFDPYIKVFKVFTKELRTDGSTLLVLDLKNDLRVTPKEGPASFYPFTSSSFSSSEIDKFLIEANVIDDVSEEQSSANKEIEIYSQPFNLKIESESVFKPDTTINFKAKVIITDLEDNPIEDSETPIEIVIGCTDDLYSTDEPIEHSYQSRIVDGFVNANVTNSNNPGYIQCYLYVVYKKSKSNTRWMRKSPLDMDILTDSPEEGKELAVKITSGDVIEEFAYEIVSRGDVIKSNHVNVPGNQTEFILRLNLTFAMVPKVTLFIHHIKSMGFRGLLKEVAVERAFPNSIEIETVKEAAPRTAVSINVSTDEGSYVGLMGLDRRVLESLSKKEILDENTVTEALGRTNFVESYYPISDYGGRIGDIITFSNAFADYPVSSEGGISEVGGQVRKLFPESWLYMDFERTPAGGLNILDTTPDTITTWAITGFSVHPDTGLTFTKNITELRVFQEFFVSFDLPGLVREGEIIEVPVFFSNYMQQDVMANVTFESDSEDLKILGDAVVSSELNQTNTIPVSAMNREKLNIFLKPLKYGKFNLTIKAVSSLANDAVQKTLNVRPQGIPKAMSKTVLVHLPEEGSQQNEVVIDIPENALAGSEKVEVSVVGDVFRPLMRDLQKFARVPYGNGEDNMRLIASNVIVLQYLRALNYSNSILENKIRVNLELGYQNQLSFKYLDGSFGLFENKNRRTGDIWQTMFALWGLKLANEFIHIDPDLLERGLEYLKMKQDDNGCYKSGNNREEDLKLTSFGLMVFLLDEPTRQASNTVISKGLKFLHENADDFEESSIFVLATYVLLLGNHESADAHLKKLSLNRKTFLKVHRPNDKQKLGAKTESLESHLETTTASLLSLFDTQEVPVQGLLHIARGLVVTKDRDESSLNHIVALEVIIGFIEKLSLTSQNLEISFHDDQDKEGVFQINDENSQVLQTVELSPKTRKLNLQSKGHGFAIVEVKYEFNLLLENKSLSNLDFKISSKKISKSLNVLSICSKTLTNETNDRLFVMEVDLQSGYLFVDGDSEEDEHLSENVKAMQVDGSGEKVKTYLELPTDIEVCVQWEVRRAYKVLNAKPGWAVLYDANNKDEDEQSVKSFRIE